MSTYSDLELTCKECAASFIFAAAEQRFFQERGLINQPKRCHDCRLSLRKQRHPEKVTKISKVPCARCQTVTTVPFEPRGTKPILCLSCMHEDKQRQKAASAAASDALTKAKQAADEPVLAG